MLIKVTILREGLQNKEILINANHIMRVEDVNATSEIPEIGHIQGNILMDNGIVYRTVETVREIYAKVLKQGPGLHQC